MKNGVLFGKKETMYLRRRKMFGCMHGKFCGMQISINSACMVLLNIKEK